MLENPNELRNNISRFLGLIGLFWTTISAFLGIPFFIIGLLLPIKTRNQKDSFFNIIFNVVCLIASILYTIFILIKINS